MRRAALRRKHQRKGLLVLSCVAGLLAAFVATPSPAAQKTTPSQQTKIWALGVSAGRVSSVRVAKLQWLRRRGIQALVVNAGALSHYGWSLADALSTFEGVVIELHISNPFARETWRHRSVIAPVSDGCVAGLGGLGYELAVIAALRKASGTAGAGE